MNENDQNIQPKIENNNYQTSSDITRRLDDDGIGKEVDINTSNNSSGPRVVIMQWLTYALWAGTIFATIIVFSSTLAYFMLDQMVGTDTSAIYGIAAICVMLPLAIVCDIFYSKYENEKKSIFSRVVMIVHAVMFSLVAIGLLVITIFSVINLIINITGTDQTMVALYVSLFSAFLYFAVFLRVVLSDQLLWVRRYFKSVMFLIVGIVIIAGISGPAGDAWRGRIDKLIESNLQTVVYAIDDYADKNNKLPAKLSEITLKDDAKKLITDKLIRYEIINNVESQSSYYSSSFYYKLCVVYGRDTNNNHVDYPSMEERTIDGDYSSYVDTYSHNKGEVCYKLRTGVSSYYNTPDVK